MTTASIAVGMAVSAIRWAVVDSLGDSTAPCTVEQLRKRFEEFLEKLTRGKELAKVRRVIEKGEGNGGQV